MLANLSTAINEPSGFFLVTNILGTNVYMAVVGCNVFIWLPPLPYVSMCTMGA